jgi:hypothetical protein
MHTLKLLLRSILLLAIVASAGSGLQAPQAGKFDRLSDEDRKTLGERFQKEVWPLLVRNGEDGCIGCHRSKQGGAALRLSGDPAKDFRTLVGQGFLLKDDAGSLLERIVDKDKKRRMPPGARPGWSEPEIKILRIFIEDLDKKNQ